LIPENQEQNRPSHQGGALEKQEFIVSPRSSQNAANFCAIRADCHVQSLRKIAEK
jgi:hypothetical protein